MQVEHHRTGTEMSGILPDVLTLAMSIPAGPTVLRRTVGPFQSATATHTQPPAWVPAILLMSAIDAARIGLFCRADECTWKAGPYIARLAWSIQVCYSRLAGLRCCVDDALERRDLHPAGAALPDASNSRETSAASAAPIRWKISSACRSLSSPWAVWPTARAHRPRPASA